MKKKGIAIVTGIVLVVIAATAAIAFANNEQPVQQPQPADKVEAQVEPAAEPQSQYQSDSDKAIEIALKDAQTRYPELNVDNIYHKSAEWDDGRWEVDIKESIPGNNYQHYEYDYEVDIETGTVYYADRELDD